MPIELTKGDIFSTADLPALAHGVDCAGEMAAGIAGQFKKRWPAMYLEYNALATTGRLDLGGVFPWIGEDVTIYNLAIQRNWREKAKIAALASAVRKMVELAEKAGITKIGMPRLGTGLGGLDWPRVVKILEDVGKATPVTLVVFTQFIRTGAPTK